MSSTATKPVRQVTPWTDQELRFLADHWESAASVLVLAYFINRSAVSVQTQASRRGMPARSDIVDIKRDDWSDGDDQNLAQIVENYRLGDGRIPIVDVADAVDRTIDAVARRLNLFKLKPDRLREIIYIPEALIDENLQKRSEKIEENPWDEDDDDEDFDYEDLMPKPKAAMRACLCCQKSFYSEGVGNRICPPCKKSSDFN